ncbi:MAG: hypothetical protein RLZZ450_845 [Pseudomonadota bacterium]|jgi:hypothetical protein
MMKTAYPLLTVLFIALAACGDGGDPPMEEQEFPASFDEHEATDVAGAQSALNSITYQLHRDYFTSPTSEVERTADGGTREFWAGEVGPAAIYGHHRRTHGELHLVYGEIFTLWQQNGADTWIGYPLEEEHDAGWGCEKDGALREQAFTPESGVGPEHHRVLCWAPGKIWTYEWVEEGVRQRLPPVQRGA